MNNNYIAFQTLLNKEVCRFLRIWTQTIIPPAVTVALYFIIFGNLIGSQLPPIQGFSYMQFITPGLILMPLITNSYSNVVGSVFISRFHHNIDDILASPLPNHLLLLAYIMAGIVRGLTVGMLIVIMSLFFVKFHIYSYSLAFLVAVFTSAIFSLIGFTNAVFAKSFDDINIIPTFVITPLTYLGGVFFSTTQLSSFWQLVARFNPILYMINGFRYAILGISDISVGHVMAVIISVTVFCFCLNLYLLHKGVGLRS